MRASPLPKSEFATAALLLGAIVTMMTIVPLRAGTDGAYFTQAMRSEQVGVADQRLEDYLSSGADTHGFFVGEGAAALGIEGNEATAEQVEHLLKGLSPDGSTQLTQVQRYRKGDKRKGRSPGHQLVFSPNKDVQVLLALGTEEQRSVIRKAEGSAWRLVLRELESEYKLARRGKGGRIKEVAKLLCAGWYHNTSRAGDPQRHLHLLVFSPVMRPDGTWAALNCQPVSQDWKRLSSTYILKLKDGLERAGFTTRVDPEHEWNFQIDGVPRELCLLFSKRRAEISAELERLGKFDPTTAQKVALATRKSKKHLQHLSIRDLRERWELAARVSGFDLNAIRRLGPAQGVQQLEQSKPSTGDLAQQVSVEAEALALKNGAFSEGQLAAKSLAKALATPGAQVEDVEAAVKEHIRELPLIHEANEAFARRYTTKTEEIRRSDCFGALRDHAALAAFPVPEAVERKVLAPTVWRSEDDAAFRAITSPKSVTGLIAPRSDERMNVLAAATKAWKEAGYLVVVTGPRGAGLRLMMTRLGISGRSLKSLLPRLVSPKEGLRRAMAKAARDRAALWSFLSPKVKQEKADKQQLPVIRLVSFLAKAFGEWRNPSPAVLLVEGAEQLTRADIQGLFELARGSEAKLVFVGAPDRGFAPGQAFHDLSEELGFPLLTSRDFSSSLELDPMEEVVINAAIGHFHAAVDVLCQEGLYTELAPGEDLVQRVIGRWLEAKPTERPLILSDEAHVLDLNKSAQHERFIAGELGSKLKRGLEDEAIFERDRVVFTSDDPKGRFFAGELGEVRHVLNDERIAAVVRIDGEKPQEIYLKPKDTEAISLGYAVGQDAIEMRSVDKTLVLLGENNTSRRMAKAFAASREAPKVFGPLHLLPPELARSVYQGRPSRVQVEDPVRQQQPHRRGLLP